MSKFIKASHLPWLRLPWSLSHQLFSRPDRVPVGDSGQASGWCSPRTNPELLLSFNEGESRQAASPSVFPHGSCTLGLVRGSSKASRQGRLARLSTLFLIVIFLFLAIGSVFALVEEEKSFTEDFRSKYRIDEIDLGANVNTELGQVTAGTGSNGYFGSWQIQSKKVAETWANINKAKLSVEAEIPSQTQIIYYLSNNNGKNWLMIESGIEYKFSSRGTELKWRAVLVSNNSNLTPKIKKLIIIYKTFDDSQSAISSRDSRRIYDLEKVSSALEKFYQDYNQYPGAYKETEKGRWKELKEVLERGDYISSMPQPEDPDRPYDYKNSSNYQGYVLRVELEDKNSNYLLNFKGYADLESQIFGLDCDDPIYCFGKNIPQEYLSDPRGAKDSRQPPLIKTVSRPEVYEIVGNKKHWIPNAEIFKNYGFDWKKINIVSQQELDKYPKLRFITTDQGYSIYYLTDSFLRRKIPNKEVISSYNLRLDDVITVSYGELNFYQESDLIKLKDNPKVYKIDWNKKYWIVSAEAFNKLKFNWSKITIVSEEELAGYVSGEEIR